MKLAHLLFSASEQFSTNLQAKDTSIYNATHGAELLVAHYNSLQHESQYDCVLQQSSGLTNESQGIRRGPDDMILVMIHTTIENLRRGTGTCILMGWS